MNPGVFTDMEINSQPEIWQATLNRIQKQWSDLARQAGPFAEKPLILTGCGSTYYLSLTLAAVLRKAGVPALAFPASELVYFPLETLPDGFNLLAVSRSGTTTETLWAAERYRQFAPAGRIGVITCVPETPLIQQADFTLLAPDAQEESVAQTRSFTSMLLLGQALAGMLSGDAQRLAHLSRLPAALETLVGRYRNLAETLGSDLNIDRFFFLGNGPLYGIANEAMLKTKEISCSWAEAYHVLEFRHGPMSVVNQSTLVAGLISDSAASAEIRVLQEMKQLGARTLAFVEKTAGLPVQGIDHQIELGSGLSEWDRCALYLPLIQRIAFARSIAKGLNPDQPVNLSAVIQLKREAR